MSTQAATLVGPRGIAVRLPQWGVDAVLATTVAGVTVWGCHSESHPSAQARQIVHGRAVSAAPAWAYLLIAAAALALVWRRRRPRTVLVASLAGVVAYAALGYVGYAALVIPPLALYAVALVAPARQAVGLGVVTLLALGGVVLTGPKDRVTSGDIALVALVAVAVLAGIAGANRRRYLDAVRGRAELDERTQRERTRRMVDAERLRIARELHDVVAHTMATINVQAGVAAYVAADLPPSTADALLAIKTASKEGLRELRAILAVLRQVDDTDASEPQPGLGRLAALAAGASAAGLATTVVTNGHLGRTLPPAIDVAAYRIVQESLTNAIRHAGPATATVDVAYDDQELCVRVTDTGCGPRTVTTSGHGLLGMRERAEAAGGSLVAGASHGGGFQVTARLPLRSRR